MTYHALIVLVLVYSFLRTSKNEVRAGFSIEHMSLYQLGCSSSMNVGRTLKMAVKNA